MNSSISAFKMTDSLLEFLHRVFVKKESDGHGVFIEFRTANFIKRNSKLKIDRIKTRYGLPQIGEIDVLGFNSKDNPIVMAECKDKKAKKEDLDKWIKNIKLIYSDYNCSLEEAYFITTEKMTDANYERIEKSDDVDAKKGQLKAITGVSKVIQYFNDKKSLGESGRVRISMYEVRKNCYVKIFPRTKK